jgi:hypothetical protein
MNEATASPDPLPKRTPLPSLPKGLFGALFDFSFTSFVTPQLIQLMFVALIALSGLATLGFIGMTFAQSTTLGLVVLLLSPIVFLFYVLWARICLELVIVVFRIYEELRLRRRA